jgi:hypothetical protein
MSVKRRKILMSLPPRKIKKFHEIIPEVRILGDRPDEK